MTTHTHRTARFAIIGASMLTALAAFPVAAQSPAQEEPCSVRGAGPCRAESLAAHQGLATVPGKSPIQAETPLARPAQPRPWLKSGG
jgi:hypothetical protein